jgi:hypothetical protein
MTGAKKVSSPNAMKMKANFLVRRLRRPSERIGLAAGLVVDPIGWTMI